jgi:hypothetical protein
MNYVTFTVFGRELKRYTFLSEEEVLYSLTKICPTINGFSFKSKENPFFSRIFYVQKRPGKSIFISSGIGKRRKSKFNYTEIVFIEDEFTVLQKHIPNLVLN